MSQIVSCFTIRCTLKDINKTQLLLFFSHRNILCFPIKNERGKSNIFKVWKLERENIKLKHMLWLRLFNLKKKKKSNVYPMLFVWSIGRGVRTEACSAERSWALVKICVVGIWNFGECSWGRALLNMPQFSLAFQEMFLVWPSSVTRRRDNTSPSLTRT